MPFSGFPFLHLAVASAFRVLRQFICEICFHFITTALNSGEPKFGVKYHIGHGSVLCSVLAPVRCYYFYLIHY